jgi:biotin carboxyl carrier protein
MRRYTVEIAGRTHVVDVDEVTADRFRVRVAGHDFEVTMGPSEDLPEAVITPEMVPVAAETAPAWRPPALEALPPVPATAPPPLAPPPLAPDEATSPEVAAPMPGTVLSVEVEPGQAVARGAALVRLEAMKMTNVIRSHRDAVVAEVRVAPGQSVAHGQVLVTFRE